MLWSLMPYLQRGGSLPIRPSITSSGNPARHLLAPPRASRRTRSSVTTSPADPTSSTQRRTAWATSRALLVGLGPVHWRASNLTPITGGNFLLGGKMLNNQTIMDVGLQLTETCADSYALMP